jgi:transposase
VAILASAASSASQTRRFAAALWHDDDPRRLELGQRLAPDHLARRIEQMVARLDLTPLRQAYAGVGSLPHCPSLLLCAILYETQRGQHSPAAWSRDARECEPLRWLLRGIVPSRSCWYAFRDRSADLLDELNEQLLHQAIAEEFTPAQRGSLDGTLIAANASRHKLANEATLTRRIEQLAVADVPASPTPAAGDTLLSPMPAATEASVPQGPPSPRPAWMAGTPQGRQQQKTRLGQAQRRMESRQQYNSQKRSSKRKQRSKVVVSLSDPEAVVGLDKEKVFRPLYNVQVLDDLDSPLILGYGVYAQANDAGLLGPMLTRTTQLLGQSLRQVLADTAYAGGADLAIAAAAGVTLLAPLPQEGPSKQLPKSAFLWQPEEQSYLCPQGHRLAYEGSSHQKRSGVELVVLHQYRCAPSHCQDCPRRGDCTKVPEKGRTVSRSEHEEQIEALRQRMAAAEAKQLYRQRCQTVELVNADWKQHRKLRRFSGRGLRRAGCQVALIVLAHNLVTLATLEKNARDAAVETVFTNPSEIDP